MVSKSFLDDLKGRVRLSEIIGAEIQVTRAGREFKACCPFHDEKTPSFTINDDKQFYHCFGCGAHGDHFGFLTHYKNLPFMEAVEELAAKAGVSVPQANPKDIRQRKDKDRLIGLMEMVAKYYTRQLHLGDNKDILDYLLSRGMGHETISAFRLGFSPERGGELYQLLKQEGYQEAELLEAGVFKKSERGGDPYPFFRGRVMFPVGDGAGRVIAFGGRIVPDHIRPYSGKGDFTPPKYINSSETRLFHKGSHLYNFSNARQAVGQGAELIVTEGYADVIAVAQAGFSGAVAPLGTALTEGQIRLLWSMLPTDYHGTQVKQPVLCFDGDAAGRKAAKRAMERVLPLLEPQCSIRFAFLPEGKDPDDLIRESGAQVFQDVIDQAVPLIDMLWHSILDGQDTGSPDARAAIEARMMGVIRTIAHQSVQGHYREVLRSRLWATFNPRQRGPIRNKKGGSGAIQAPPTPLSRPGSSMQGVRLRAVMAALIRNPSLFDSYEEGLGCLPCANQPLDHCRQVFISLLSENPGLDTEGIRKELEARADREEIEKILGSSTSLSAPFCSADASLDQVTNGLDDLLLRAMQSVAAHG